MAIFEDFSGRLDSNSRFESHCSNLKFTFTCRETEHFFGPNINQITWVILIVLS